MIYIYIYICVFIYTNLPINVNRLTLPWSEDSQGQKTFLAPSADKQSRNYDKGCSNTIFPNYHKVLGLNRSEIKWWAIIPNLPRDVIVRPAYPWSEDEQSQETFLAPYADKQTLNYDTECLNTILPNCRDWAVARWNDELYIQIYQEMSYPGYPSVVSTICIDSFRY